MLPRGIVLGSGLVALDLYSVADGCLWNVGGTVANVLSILGALGHQAFPVGTIGADDAASAVLRRLEACGVSTEGILSCSNVSTPFLACERVSDERGYGSMHAHRWWCWECQERYPSFKEPAERTFQSQPLIDLRPSFFFVDRVSTAALQYAKTLKMKGTKIYLEPAFTTKGTSEKPAVSGVIW